MRQLPHLPHCGYGPVFAKTFAGVFAEIVLVFAKPFYPFACKDCCLVFAGALPVVSAEIFLM